MVENNFLNNMKKIIIFIFMAVCTTVFANNYYSKDFFLENITATASENHLNDEVSKALKTMLDTGILDELVSIIGRANIDPKGVNAWFVSLANSGDPFIDFLALDDMNVYNVRVWLDYKSLKPRGRLIFNSITDKQKQQLRDILNAIEGDLIYNDKLVLHPFLTFFQKIGPQNQKKSYLSVTGRTLKDTSVERNIDRLKVEMYRLLGLDFTGTDFSRASAFSLSRQLQSKSIERFNDIDKSLKFFMQGKLLSEYKSIWQYYSASEDRLGQYMALWIFLINDSICNNTPVKAEEILRALSDDDLIKIAKENNLLSQYILYKYYLNKKDFINADKYKQLLQAAKISPILLN